MARIEHEKETAGCDFVDDLDSHAQNQHVPEQILEPVSSRLVVNHIVSESQPFDEENVQKANDDINRYAIIQSQLGSTLRPTVFKSFFSSYKA